jgi:hypothetical protein
MRDGRVNFISHPNPAQHSDEKVANRDVRDFGWAIAHAAVSPRPPNPSYTIVTRTEGYTCDAKVWDLSIVQGPFSVAPCQTVALRFATFSSLCEAGFGWDEVHAAGSHMSLCGSRCLSLTKNSDSQN